ncbi:hypothetical protein BGZ81_004810 [Podila clonocystis]|nr:hypothetical protein BGZ81_004810 [Podila clonocystis]
MKMLQYDTKLPLESYPCRLGQGVQPLLKELEYARGGFIGPIFLAMERHLGTLEWLNMIGAGFRSWVVQQVMVSCSRLTGKPWQCLDLLVLKVGVRIKSTNKSRAVFQRLTC